MAWLCILLCISSSAEFAWMGAFQFTAYVSFFAVLSLAKASSVVLPAVLGLLGLVMVVRPVLIGTVGAAVAAILQKGRWNNRSKSVGPKLLVDHIPRHD